ncbi:MAG: TetR/AcrR family transcriptional regulator [Acidimicrobiaceae bacterium]|nr:TetR/AcrR family transcriptional regulator [Acidimicrobiaceae bacterium]
MAVAGRRSAVDGRVLRGRRNRQAVVASFLTLIEEGDLRPTARAIADRAGVSLRSVFQHFEDLEQIYAAAGQLENEKLDPMLQPVDRRLSLDARLETFVARRRELLETLDPVARAARLREPFSAQLQANRDRLIQLSRQQCEATFARELSRLKEAARRQLLDAMAVSTSWSSWYFLTEEMGLGPDAATDAIRTNLRSLLKSS